MKQSQELRLPALRVAQGPNKTLFSFAVDGKLLRSFAAVSRIRRKSDNAIGGYQRPEVISHIAEIRAYLESDSPILPNALVLAFDERVHFEEGPDDNTVDYASHGTLVIPIDDTWEDVDKPAWIVDGQQRAAAVRDAAIEKFPLCVVGFIAATLAEQREQFILVNSTKPLPKSLVHELLPAIDGKLPSALARRRFPAYLMDRLNHDEDSPFRGLIKTATAREGVIQDNSVLRMVENSLTDGALYRFRGRTDEDNDVAAMLSLLKGFWTAAADVFSNAWGISPKRSRLMHGAGIVSMGFVMDAIADQLRHLDRVVADDFVSDLRELAPACRWTDGFWDFGPGAQRRWNEIQNTSSDVRLLTNYLLVQYRHCLESMIT